MDGQTDRQTTYCTIGSTDSTVGQKLELTFNFYMPTPGFKGLTRIVSKDVLTSLAYFSKQHSGFKISSLIGPV